MQSSFNKCLEFMIATDQIIYNTPQPNLFIDNIERTKRRINIIKEEIRETKDAMVQNNFIEVMDGLGDIEYTINIIGAAFGIDLDKEFHVKHSIRMNKDCDIQQTNFKKYINFMENTGHNVPKYNLDNINEKIYLLEMAEIYIEESVRDNNFNKFVDGLINALYVVYGIAYAFGINLDEIYRIIHESNMTKICTTEEEAIQTIEWYVKNKNDRYKNPEYKKSKDQQYWIMYDKITGKILKSINFIPPKFTV